MTIVFVVDSFPSISETFILNQITGLIDLGHDVLIFSASRPDERESHDDIRKYDLLKKTYYHNDRPSSKFKRVLWALCLIVAYGHRNPRAVLNALNIFKYGREALSLTYLYKIMLFLGVGKIDIIFCHYGPNGDFAALMKEMGVRGKIVTMFHGYDIRRGIENNGKEMYRRLFQQGDRFLSISNYNHGHLLLFGAPAEKIVDHPVGIDLDRYPFVERRMPADGPVKILTVSRLVKEKGIGYGLQTLNRMFNERAIFNMEYYVLGDGPEREELETLARNFQLKGKVYFLGSQNQTGVIEMLRQAHIFFLPSVAEALPVVLMEAQAAGLPVVGTDVGSVKQVMVDGQSGFMVPSMDTRAMCDKLEYLVRHPDQWPAMGRAGRKHIEEHYDIKKLNQRLEGLFKELIRS